MKYPLLTLVGALALGLLPLRAGLAQEPPAADKGTFLGLLFSPLTPAPTSGSGTEKLALDYKITPSVKVAPTEAAGVLITHVLPGSPAARAGLRRHDVLLGYDRARVRDCEQLALLIRDDKPERKVKLLIARDKREMTVEATLALGPALRIAPSYRPTKPGVGKTGPGGITDTNAPGTARGPLRPASTSLASVSIVATPLDGGKMKLTMEFYADGRLQQTVTCQGAAGDLATTVQKLPERERNLVRVALQRLRTLSNQTGPPAMGPPAKR